LRRAAITLAFAALLAGCGQGQPSPGEIAQNYVTSIAEGNYADACSVLNGHAREALRASMRSRAGCATLLARCLPTNASVLQKDQAQLFYANVEITTDGPNATVRTSGTAVAKKIHEVTLAKTQGKWQLTSYGEVRCRAGHGRAKTARS
jgi:Domain of unknown function (DUF4878)